MSPVLLSTLPSPTGPRYTPLCPQDTYHDMSSNVFGHIGHAYGRATGDDRPVREFVSMPADEQSGRYSFTFSISRRTVPPHPYTRERQRCPAIMTACDQGE